MAKENKVLQSMIDNNYNKYNEVINITFNDVDPKSKEQKEYTIKFYPYFKPERIENMFKQLQKDLNEMNVDGEVKVEDNHLPLFVIYHIIKEFSNLPLSNSKDVNKRIAYFYKFINTDYFKLVEQHILQDEFNKVWDNLIEIMKANEKINRMAKKIQSEIQSLDLKSPELRARLQPKRIPEA